MDFKTGVIKAVGMSGGIIAATHEVRTAAIPAKITLAVNKNTIANTWDDVVFVNVSVTDGNGTIVPDADDLINFTVRGAGAVAAVDNADSYSHEPYQAPQRKAFQGMCLALIRATGNQGKIKLTATSPGLEGDAIEIRVRPARVRE